MHHEIRALLIIDRQLNVIIHLPPLSYLYHYQCVIIITINHYNYDITL